jgi:hypothetical protein
VGRIEASAAAVERQSGRAALSGVDLSHQATKMEENEGGTDYRTVERGLYLFFSSKLEICDWNNKTEKKLSV